ncbi:hypothetical protein NHX12_023832 [Muraenolepis orangiensis]|uniref:Uncharacterized protein n=1 Tax=Muraenolepis orangiensis TaxID=630683 RepID=A0A9Q0ISG5_9TELE|nr:hypothetical protein NHX12_023832 [Muraenolepis orangiensis]
MAATATYRLLRPPAVSHGRHCYVPSVTAPLPCRHCYVPYVTPPAVSHGRHCYVSSVTAARCLPWPPRRRVFSALMCTQPLTRPYDRGGEAGRFRARSQRGVRTPSPLHHTGWSESRLRIPTGS